MTDRTIPHDPGGKVTMAVRPEIRSRCVFSPCSRYRYSLERTWDERPAVLVIMMNPSMATESVDDPTVAKVTRMAMRWGYGSLLVGNVFAYRATDQAVLAQASDPIGPHNDFWLNTMAETAERVVFAYGQPKAKNLRSRGLEVARTLIAKGIEPHALRLSKDGTPYHPLYLRDDTAPTEWSPR